MTAHRAVLACAAVAVVSACGSYEPPASSTAVLAQERQVTPAVEAAARSKVGASATGSCKVRLLGREEDVTYVWGECRFPQGTAISTPFRVDHGVAKAPGDGPEFAASVRRLFPRDIAKVILADPDSLRP